MSRTTYTQTIAGAKRQITNSSNAVFASRKLIYKGNSLVNNTKTSITNSKYCFASSVTFLTNDFLIATLQEFTNILNLKAIQNLRKNNQGDFCLTPQENLQQIMTHPFKTGLCPYCGHTFPKVKSWSVNWNCLFCGWSDNLFN